MVQVLRGIVADAEMPAVPLQSLAFTDEFRKPPYSYRLLDGFHRFYASLAVGFECLPGLPVA